LQDFGDEWWSRWQQTMAPTDLPRYEALGIGYVVLQSPNRLPQPAVFENARYVAYAEQNGSDPFIKADPVAQPR
jgi:hypothetical protein